MLVQKKVKLSVSFSYLLWIFKLFFCFFFFVCFLYIFQAIGFFFAPFKPNWSWIKLCSKCSKMNDCIINKIDRLSYLFGYLLSKQYKNNNLIFIIRLLFGNIILNTKQDIFFLYISKKCCLQKLFICKRSYIAFVRDKIK